MPSYQAERMELIERAMALAPAYQRAVEEENLERLLILRQELAATLAQADSVILACMGSSLERRLAEDTEAPLTTQ